MQDTGQPCPHIHLPSEAGWIYSDPIVMTDSLVFVDAIEAKTGNAMRVGIPVKVINMADVKVVASRQDS